MFLPFLWHKMCSKNLGVIKELLVLRFDQLKYKNEKFFKLVFHGKKKPKFPYGAMRVEKAEFCCITVNEISLTSKNCK